MFIESLYFHCNLVCTEPKERDFDARKGIITRFYTPPPKKKPTKKTPKKHKREDVHLNVALQYTFIKTYLLKAMHIFSLDYK
jgi:hypothetical protein